MYHTVEYSVFFMCIARHAWTCCWTWRASSFIDSSNPSWFRSLTALLRAVSPVHIASFSSGVQASMSVTGVPDSGQTRIPPAKSEAWSSCQFLEDVDAVLRSALRVSAEVCAATCRRAVHASLPRSSSIFAGLPPRVNGTLATNWPMAVSRMRVSMEIRTMSLASVLVKPLGA